MKLAKEKGLWKKSHYFLFERKNIESVNLSIGLAKLYIVLVKKILKNSVFCIVYLWIIKLLIQGLWNIQRN